MRLRLRVALATVAAIVPIMTLIAWARLHERETLLAEDTGREALRRRAMMMRQDGPRPARLGLVFPVHVLLPVTLVAFGAVLLATGPIVRRVRRLTKEVNDSAKDDYRNTITVRGDDEIGELARAFVEAGDAIRTQMARQQRRERALRAFLENTTHDVMIPLTVLHGHLAAFRQRAEQGQLLDPASIVPAMNEAHYMASLVHNLALAAALEAGEPELRQDSVSLGEVVERVVGRHAPIARQRRIQLDHAIPEEPLRVRGDVTMIEQALSNIVSNAVRYNHDEGHVAVLLEARGAGRFVLRVTDDGPGISEEERARLVERHVRGDAARSREPQGRGLGLHIAFCVARAHGWDLRLSAPPEGGFQSEIDGFRET
ncbi:sensor histidine kinase [Pendulispora albinea]|uniref:histidine kinase n=1 Tax=Pendulispora albinea TaxID=2741071 RepID=A0ABZ2LY01_9BACT